MRRIITLAIIAVIAVVLIASAGRLVTKEQDSTPGSAGPGAHPGGVGPLDWPGESLFSPHSPFLELTSLTPMVGFGGFGGWAIADGDLQDPGFAELPVGDVAAGEEPPATTPAQVGNILGPAAMGDGRPKVALHEVKAGDTIWDIAGAFGVSVDTVAAANGLSSPSRIHVGQVLRVLTVDGVLHRVERGETLASISARYKVDPLIIGQANDLTDPPNLVEGRELIIPGAVPVTVHRLTVGGKTVTIYGKFLWPVAGSITSSFGWRWGRFHHGIDIGAPHGRSITASRAGRVSFAGWKGGYGYTVIIDHNEGLATLYGHASSLLVKTGQRVEAGQVIARVGSTGYSTGPHLHFEVRINGTAINPLLVLN